MSNRNPGGRQYAAHRFFDGLKEGVSYEILEIKSLHHPTPVANFSSGEKAVVGQGVGSEQKMQSLLNPPKSYFV